MEVKMIWANLVSNNLDKTVKFYTDLGFKLNGNHQSKELVSIFFGKDNFVINFFIPQRFEDSLKNKPVHENEILFSLSANSKEEVDQWVEKVKAAGGTVFSDPEKYEQGYTFGFADPDGHKFNILHWPGM